MENEKIDSRNNFNIFCQIFKNTILLSLKKYYLHIAGAVYLGISLIFVSILAFSAYDFIEGSLVPIANLFYVFSTFTLFIFVTIVMLYFFHNHKKTGLLKLEQREGVPLYISYTVRLINTYLFVLIYQLILIILANTFFFKNAYNYYSFKIPFTFKVFNLQPAITLVVITIVSLFIIPLGSVGGTFFPVIIGLFYAISPMTSVAIASMKDSNISKNNINLNSLVANIKLGEKFYDLTKSDLTGVYNKGDEYFKILNELNDKDMTVNADELRINNIYDIYKFNGQLIRDIFGNGVIMPTSKQQGGSDKYLSKWNFYKNYLSQINDISNSNFSFKNNYNYFDYRNSFFSDYDENNPSITDNLQNLNFKISFYKQFLDKLIEKLDNVNTKIVNLVKFAKENIDSLFDTYKISVFGFPNLKDNSLIPLVIGMSDIYSLDNNKIKVNVMLSQLNWELLIFYNLTLNPILNKSYTIDNYFEAKKEETFYKNFDSLVFTNHLYTMAYYKLDKDKTLQMINNSFRVNTIQSKNILRPFRTEISGDDKLFSTIKKSDKLPNISSLPYYESGLKVELKKNVNVNIMFIVYPVICLGMLLCTYYLFIYRSRK